MYDSSQKKREDKILRILSVGVHVMSQRKRSKYSVSYAMTVEGQARCLLLTSMQLLKEILQISQQIINKYFWKKV